MSREKGFQSTICALTEKQRSSIIHYATQWVFPEHRTTEEIYSEIAKLVSQLHYFSESRDFFVLHGATCMPSGRFLFTKLASFGVNYILKELEDDAAFDFLKYYWLSLLYVYVVQRCPPLSRDEPEVTSVNIFSN